MSTSLGGTATTILRDTATPEVNPVGSRCIQCGADGRFLDIDWRCGVCGPKPPPDKAADLLDEAKKIVTGARRQSYGKPEDNFQCIADFWNVYLTRRAAASGFAINYVINAKDVANMMILMKTTRLAESPDHHDSAVDIAGYAACLARVQA